MAYINGKKITFPILVKGEKAKETKSVTLNLASGNQEVTPTDEQHEMIKVIINKPSTLLAENIKKDINIAGVVGTYDPATGGDTLEQVLTKTITTYTTYANNISVGTQLFNGCLSLESAYFLGIVGSVGESSFIGCRALKRVEFGSLSYINRNAFTNCSSLVTIVIGGTEVCNLRYQMALPYSSTRLITIYVPSNLIESYKTATNWSNLYNDGYIDFAAISS